MNGFGRYIGDAKTAKTAGLPHGGVPCKAFGMKPKDEQGGS